MIAKTHLLRELKYLKKLFNQAVYKRITYPPEFFAKLAVLEVCGWIEESLRDLVSRCAKKQGLSDIEKFKKIVFGRVYSFDYDNHFSHVLYKTIGFVAFQKLEKGVGSTVKDRLRLNLEQLKEKRDRLAHSSLPGSGIRPDSPSVTINTFEQLFEDMKTYEAELKKFKGGHF